MAKDNLLGNRNLVIFFLKKVEHKESPKFLSYMSFIRSPKQSSPFPIYLFGNKQDKL